MTAVDVSSVLEAPEIELLNKNLIDEVTWERLVSRIVEDEGLNRPLAERVMDQTLGFLSLVKFEPDGHYSPSALVDIGWHTFILYTKSYAAFCRDFVGHFIHHDPTDMPGVDYSSGSTSVDDALWAHFHANDCTESDGDGDQGCKGGSCNY